MMQTAAVQKISEQNSPYKAMLDRAYMIGKPLIIHATT